jgi:8-hydroxy-5-deazaflavin:NADPH oxidoreductase
MVESVAIIGGTGDEGRGLALRWARAGLRVILGSREAQRAGAVAQEIEKRAGASARVEGAENAAAAGASSVVVLTVPFEAQVSTLKHIRATLRPGTVLICTTVPLAAGVGDRATRVLGVWQGSAAEQVAEFAPEGVRVVGAFHNISAALLESEHAVECDAIVCANDAGARQVANELAHAIPGVRAVDGGALENCRIVEQITALLITLNIRNKVKHAGIRITGIGLPS